MISNIIKPSKSELLRNIQSLKNPNIEVIEVLERGDKLKLNSLFDMMLRKGNFSIILIREK